jgi:hypothetical protein
MGPKRDIHKIFGSYYWVLIASRMRGAEFSIDLYNNNIEPSITQAKAYQARQRKLREKANTAPFEACGQHPAN